MSVRSAPHLAHSVHDPFQYSSMGEHDSSIGKRI
jgi:hypothetical protein